MKFLEAKKKAKLAAQYSPLPITLFGSGQLENLSPYFEAFGVIQEYQFQITFPSFDSLAPSLMAASSSPPVKEEVALAVLLPWDFCPALNWRYCSVEQDFSLEELLQQVEEMTELLSSHPLKGAFVMAPCMNVLASSEQQQVLQNAIHSSAVRLGFVLVEPVVFSLSSFLKVGMPLSNKGAVQVAEILARECIGLLDKHREPKKLLITDLDNTAWAGVVGEDGVAGIRCSLQEGAQHFLYQQSIKRLQARGILLAVVTKNDNDLATAAFDSVDMPLALADFSAFVASYDLKSKAIQQIVAELNLGLSSVVFVDDNPVEIAEVSSALPEVTCLPFPNQLDDVAGLLDALANEFDAKVVTEEDSRRGELYRIRRAAQNEKNEAVSLESYLNNLQMKLEIKVNQKVDLERSVQLINKTNQFNVNGIRRSQADVEACLLEGGALFSASLADKFGDHGDILTCLIDNKGVIINLVMSCRVLQRKVEHAFFYWLTQKTGVKLQAVQYVPTERNTPIGLFLKEVLPTQSFPPEDAGGLVDLSNCVFPNPGHHHIMDDS